MESAPIRELRWVGRSLADLKEFPEDVQDVLGYALHVAQTGGKHPSAKPLRGDPAFTGAGVLEVVDDYDGDTYRAVYTVRYGDVVYALHCFQKKVKHGIQTPQREIDLVKRRLKTAAADYATRKAGTA